MQVCCKSLALPTRATEPPGAATRGIMLRMRTDIAAASADAVASPAALRLRQPPQEAANLYSIHASVIDHALPRIASPRLASPAGRLSRHTTRATASPSYATHSVSSAVLPSPSAGIFPLLTTGGLTPVMPETLSPTSNLAGLGLGLEGGGLPRCLAPSLAHKILHPISLVFRDTERGPLDGLRPPSGPNVPPPCCVRRRPCACAAPLDPLPMSDELSNNRPASRPTRHAAAALSLRPLRCVPRPLTGLAC
ncbi:hypothetical protein Purlil1_7585 [Purpureocillium lilacinum]|uniref:Uncharacterized protein n=1 Tax=Purpureocillium lilacinum TaxID=33203 RepID=A0ABR0BVP0_PURLI|nr:hypothetical protein Purlil1_7585 [Purpureocillium lilacinum]